MEALNDADLKRDRAAAYGHAPPAAHRMPPGEPPGLHDYPPPPPVVAIPHPWNSTTAPYDAADHRAPAPALHQPTYPPHAYPPPGREPPPRYGPEHTFSRQGSTSGPAHSPDAPSSQYHAVNGNAPEGAYYPAHGPHDYRPPLSYGAPPDTPNGSQPPAGLQLVIGSEMMSGQQAGPASAHYGPTSAGGSQTPSYPFYGEMYAGQRMKPVRAA